MVKTKQKTGLNGILFFRKRLRSILHGLVCDILNARYFYNILENAVLWSMFHVISSNKLVKWLDADRGVVFNDMIHSHSHAEKSGIAMCVGCGSQIHDQYIMRVSPDLEWHAACLKCAECSQYLDETCTCFVRDGKTYCKRDYARWGI